MPIKKINQFLNLESSSGIILFSMAILSMIWANSPYANLQRHFVDNFLFWINEGLMTIFFLVVGLELKREYLSGQFSNLNQVLLPAAAAVGGMLVPAAIYMLINHHDVVTLRGWATPVATDIAFALGVLSLFPRVPAQLKIFLLALAIFDDLGAILIIAIFFSHGLSYVWLIISITLFLFLLLLNISSVRRIVPYLIVGFALWFSLLHAGIHPTIGGVLLGFTIPDSDEEHSPLHRLENFLHPWVAYFVMPLFALANAGLSLSGISLSFFTDTIVLGIILGLFIGKQLGVFGFSWLVIKLGLSKLPRASTWRSLYGISLLCGVGFTMSLFLGTLAFGNQELYLEKVRLGVIVGSLLSGIVGALVLTNVFKRKGVTHP